jgi:hypothetical protein
LVPMRRVALLVPDFGVGVDDDDDEDDDDE